MDWIHIAVFFTMQQRKFFFLIVKQTTTGKSQGNKKIYFRYNPLIDKFDYYGGHGTHVAGTLLGENAPETKYNVK